MFDSEELAELVEPGQSEAGVAAQFDFDARKCGLQSGHQTQQHGHDASVRAGIAGTQAGRQQAAGVALEDQHGVIHVLVVSAVEEAELLVAVGGIVGGIEIEEDLAGLQDFAAAQTNELPTESVAEADKIASGRRVFPAAQSGLGAEREAEFLVGDDLQQRVMAQAVGIVGIFVTGNDLIQTLPQQGERVVLNAILISRIAQRHRPVLGQMMALIEGAQRQ